MRALRFFLTDRAAWVMSIYFFLGALIVWFKHIMPNLDLSSVDCLRNSLDQLKAKVLDFGTLKRYPDFRQVFMRTPVNLSKVESNHSHPLSAAARSGENNFLMSVASRCGLKPYCYSMSKSDQRKNLDGSRLYYFPKDLKMESQCDVIQPNHMICMTDVDYYVNINEILGGFLPKFANCVAISTFAPQEPAGTAKEFSWSTENDEVHVQINGLAYYPHKLWDYTRETLCIHRWWGCTVYSVERRVGTNQTRSLLFINPLRTIMAPFSYIMQGNALERKVTTYDRINWTRSFDREGLVHYLSLNKKGSVSCVEIQDNAFCSALIRLENSKTDILQGNVERIFSAAKVAEPAFAAGLFVQLFPKIGKYPNLHNFGVIPDTHTYQAVSPLLTEDGKPSMRRFMNPIVDKAWAPAVSLNNDTAMIEGRIDSVAPRATPIKPFYSQMCFNEFVELVVGEHRNTLHPVSFDVVNERQPRPSQRSLFRRAIDWLGLGQYVISSFQKKEAYNKIAPPRNISTVPTDQKIRMSSFTYSFYDNFLSKQEWYAFGKPPKELVMAVRRVVEAFESVDGSDISRLDGSVNQLLGDVYSAIMLGMFDVSYLVELAELLESARYADGYTSQNVKYNTGTSTPSGDPITAGRNTIILAFCYYCVLRSMGFSPSEAYKKLGLFGGDDGLQGGVTAVKVEEVFKDLDLLVKRDTFLKGQPVKFLGRVFLDPWTTDTCFADVPRQLGKLHLTGSNALIVSDHVVMRRKAEAFLVTDPNTPLLSEWAKFVMRMTGPAEDVPKEATRYDISWFSIYVENFQPISESQMDAALDYVCHELGITVEVLKAYCIYLHTNPNPFRLKLLVEQEFISEIPVMVAGNVEGATKSGPKKSGTPLDKGQIRRRTVAEVLADLGPTGGEPIISQAYKKNSVEPKIHVLSKEPAFGSKSMSSLLDKFRGRAGVNYPAGSPNTTIPSASIVPGQGLDAASSGYPNPKDYNDANIPDSTGVFVNPFSVGIEIHGDGQAIPLTELEGTSSESTSSEGRGPEGSERRRLRRARKRERAKAAKLTARTTPSHVLEDETI